MYFTRAIFRIGCTKLPLTISRCSLRLTLERSFHVRRDSSKLWKEIQFRRLLPISFGVGAVFGLLYNECCPDGMKPFISPVLAARDSPKEQFNFIADVVDSALPSVVTIKVSKPQGDVNASGFIISPDGFILTNAHLFPMFGGFSAAITLWDGRKFSATLEAIDMDKDLALLKVDEKNLPVTKLGRSADVRVGEWVVAIGSPLSLKRTVTARVVSSAHRRASEIGIRRRIAEYIQTDTAITFGNSGGPLLNLDAEAIGINTMMMVPGIAFAIPVDTVREFLQTVDAKRRGIYKEPKKRVLGMKMLSLSHEIIEALEQKNKLFLPVSMGVIVFDVFLNSPAEKGGLKRGDIIVKVNDKTVNYVDDIYDALISSDVLKFKVLREMSELILEVHPEVL